MHLGGVQEIQVDVPPHRRHQRGSPPNSEERPLPRRPVLPPQRNQPRICRTTAGTARYPLAGAALPPQIFPRKMAPRASITTEALRPLVSYFLARQHPPNWKTPSNAPWVFSSDSDIGVNLLPDHIVGRGGSVPDLQDAGAGATLFGIMKTANSTSSSTVWRSAAGIRPKRPNSSTSRSPP